MASDVKDSLNNKPKNELFNINEVDLSRLRTIIKSNISKHQYHTALFWADKVVTFSNSVRDAFTYAQCLYLTGQYHRGATYILKRHLHLTDRQSQYLAAKCQYSCKNFSGALNTLETPDKSLTSPPDPDDPEERRLEAAIYLLKGQILESMENRELAVECFTRALHYDVFCFEAFNSLVQHHMMTRQQENALLNDLPISKQCFPEEAKLLKLLYTLQLKKYDGPAALELLNPPSPEESPDPQITYSANLLRSNLDVRTAIAERLYYNCDYHSCFRLTQEILELDPFHPQCLPIHISCLMELKKTSDLFSLAHELVEKAADQVIAWYAVGCYYLLINKRDAARRYLSKATMMDKVFGPAWLMFGHSFAVENEHDQAMSAYFKASQLMKGCHLPLLYIGLEYGLNNNPKLAEKFFSQALALAPDDPFVLHELGVVAFHNGDYTTAQRLFNQALDRVASASTYNQIAEKWEPLLNNLAHTARKLKNYDQALEFHHKALVLSPQNPSTLASMGYVYVLQKEWSKAVDMFHKALGLQKDDTFSTTMLTHSIEHLLGEDSLCDGEELGDPGSIQKSQLSQTAPEEEILGVEELSFVDMPP